MVKIAAGPYPHFETWVQHELPQVATDPLKAVIWRCFCQQSGLDIPTAIDAISPDGIRAPNLLVTDLEEYSANGLFDATDPHSIQIAAAVVQRFESNSNDPMMALLVEAIILHELIHWADFRDGTFDTQTGPDDPGARFEFAAYGMRVGRFWEDKASPFEAAGFSDVHGIEATG